MAQVDASIYSNLLRPVKSVQEYDAEAQQAEGNKLSLLLQRGQYDAQQRGAASDNAFRTALGAPDANLGDAGFQRRLYGIDPAKAQAVIKGYAEQQAAQSNLTKAQYDAIQQKYQIAGQIMGGVTDQASWDRARQQTAQVFGPEAAAQMPAQYDPKLIEEKRLQALDAKAQFENHWKAVSSGQTDQQLAETARNNKAQTETARRGQDITVRGQNMTDSRARDFNAVQVEGNNIKRDEKKAAQDLTKNSQVASFDTMLGTLDRLTKHPGLSRSVGVVGAFPTMPGSESANFQAELDTFQSQAFIPMVAQLKGMGALSDAEGKKLTAAVGALNPKMGEQAFRDSVARITADMEAARTRVAGQPRAGGASGEWGGAASKAPKAGAVDGGYRFKGGNPADKSNWEKVK